MNQVDKVISQWRQVRPDIDGRPMSVFGRLSRAAKVVTKIEERGFSAIGLNTPGFDVLSALRRSGPPYAMTAGELSCAMMITTGTMTNRIDQLEKAGLVQRSSDPADARRTAVGLTTKGFERIDRGIDDHVNLLRGLLAGITDEEVELLDSLLRRLEESVENADV